MYGDISSEVTDQYTSKEKCEETQGDGETSSNL
jgi:hypothetical protein